MKGTPGRHYRVSDETQELLKAIRDAEGSDTWDAVFSAIAKEYVRRRPKLREEIGLTLDHAEARA